MTRTTVIVAFASWLLVTGAAPGATVEEMRAATVKITVEHAEGTAVGSGIVMCHDGDRLDVLTARHVVSGVGLIGVGARFRDVRKIEVAFYRNARAPVTVAARDVQKAELKDLAVITVRGVRGRMTKATLGTSRALSAPKTVQSIGHHLALNDGDWFWTDGKVQRAGEFILHSSQITGGFSGGPLYDAAGEVVGVNIQTVAGVARAMRIEEAALTIQSWVGPQCLGGSAPGSAGAVPSGPKAVQPGPWKDPVLGIEFAYVEPGNFWMGSPAAEAGREDDERRHRVTLTRGFWIATTELTKRQFAEFINETKYETEAERQGYSWSWSGKEWQEQEGVTWRDSGGSEHPVAHVSWNDAKAFCKWHSERLGLEIRLPTEAEWEYAARAGSDSATYAGDLTIRGNCDAPELEGIAWYCGNSDGKAHPVGRKSANDWGLHDMVGNLWEWTEDAADWDSEKNLVVTDTYDTNATDPRSTRGLYRVLRGGGWINFAHYCRAANRRADAPGIRIDYVGFRLVRTAP